MHNPCFNKIYTHIITPTPTPTPPHTFTYTHKLPYYVNAGSVWSTHTHTNTHTPGSVCGIHCAFQRTPYARADLLTTECRLTQACVKCTQHKQGWRCGIVHAHRGVVICRKGSQACTMSSQTSLREMRTAPHLHSA